MNIYEQMNELVACTDLLEIGARFIKFSEDVLNEKNKKTILKHFYERFYSFTAIDLMFNFDKSTKNYSIHSGSDAIKKYLFLTIPRETTPVKTLHSLKAYGQMIMEKYQKPIGKVITSETVLSILDYLDQEYEFSSKVFGPGKTYLLVFDYGHREFNSECAFSETAQLICPHIFLYHMNGTSDITPEAVFFHELGHALHARVTNNIEIIPQPIIQYLKNLCFPALDQCSLYQQKEILADVLGTGLLYNSPYIKYDPFPQIHESDKACFNVFAKIMLSNLSF